MIRVMNFTIFYEPENSLMVVVSDRYGTTVEKVETFSKLSKVIKDRLLNEALAPNELERMIRPKFLQKQAD